jgi:hypothetical protein
MSDSRSILPPEYERAMAFLRQHRGEFAANLEIVLRISPTSAQKYLSSIIDEVTMFAPEGGGLPSAAALLRAVPSNDDNDAPEPAEAPRETKTVHKAVPTRVLEYAVLKWLTVRAGRRCDRRIIYDALLRPFPGLGNQNAFKTRLNNFRSGDKPLVDWTAGKHSAAITITDEGHTRRVELEACGPKGLLPEELRWFAESPEWAEALEKAGRS